MNRSQRLRRAMVTEMEREGLIRSAPVREAFLAVPREIFVADFAKKNGLDDVYKHDVPIPTRFDPDGLSTSSSSAPTIMAVMLEDLRLELGHRVLEIGAGTGYNAALMKHIVGPRGRVTSIDIEPANVRGARRALKGAGYAARLVTGDGRQGVAADAPYDRVIATVSADRVPRAWARQLRKGGLAQLPLQLSESVFLPQVVVTVCKSRDGLESVDVRHGGFMGLRDAASAPATVGRYLAVLERGGGGQERSLVTLSGAALTRFTDDQKRRLLSLSLANERVTTVRPGGNMSGFQAYLTLAAPQERIVAGGWGLVDANARSFAFIYPRRTRAVITASGGDWAGKKLAMLLDGWTELGSPQVGRLRIRVTYGKQPPRAWRTFRRGDCVLSFDWRKPTT